MASKQEMFERVSKAWTHARGREQDEEREELAARDRGDAAAAAQHRERARYWYGYRVACEHVIEACRGRRTTKPKR